MPSHRLRLFEVFLLAFPMQLCRVKLKPGMNSSNLYCPDQRSAGHGKQSRTRQFRRVSESSQFVLSPDMPFLTGRRRPRQTQRTARFSDPVVDSKPPSLAQTFLRKARKTPPYPLPEQALYPDFILTEDANPCRSHSYLDGYGK